MRCREYDTKYHRTKKRKKYRTKLNKANRDAGTYRNKDSYDMSHTKSGRLVKENYKKKTEQGIGVRNKFVYLLKIYLKSIKV